MRDTEGPSEGAFSSVGSIDTEGFWDGDDDGLCVVGLGVGLLVGLGVGLRVGRRVGCTVGFTVDGFLI